MLCNNCTKVSEKSDAKKLCKYCWNDEQNEDSDETDSDFDYEAAAKGNDFAKIVTGTVGVKDVEVTRMKPASSI